MTRDELDRTRSRILNALRRTIEGARQQRARVISRAEEAPRLLAGSPYEVVDLTGNPGTDLDYYAFELVRLQDLARLTLEVFENPGEVREGLAAFDAAIPHLRKIRNALTHPGEDGRLDQVAWFSKVVELKAGGNAETLLDPRYGHHEAAEALASVLQDFLRRGLSRLG